MVRCRVAVWASLVAAAVTASADAAESDGVKAVYTTARKEAEQAIASKQYVTALAACEKFLDDFPDSPPFSRGMTVLANNALSAIRAGGPDGARRHAALCEELLARHGDAPEMLCLASVQLAQWWLYGAAEAERDPVKADALLEAALTQLADRLPADYYLGYNVLSLRLATLRYQRKLDEAEAWVAEAAERSPHMLAEASFLKAVCDVARDRRDAAKRLSAAKLYFVLCDYAEKPIAEATELLGQALHAAQGPGAVLRFAEFQKTGEGANPLVDVKLPPIGERERLLASAGMSLDAQLNAYLALYDLPAALETAKQQLASSADRPAADVAKALRNLARCFKAKDLHLLRANRFLEYHQTGQGENPLMDLEDELLAEAGP